MRNAKVKLWPLKSKVGRLGSRVGHFETEMELKGFTLLLIKVGFLSFEMCFEVISRSKWAVISKENDRIDFLQCEKKKNPKRHINSQKMSRLVMFSPVIS